MGKKMKNKILLLSFIIYVFSSCSENSFEDVLFRTTDDPFYDVPKVDSLSIENRIYISWEKDDGCDTFYLMRSIDQRNLSFECIYSGTETNYKDIRLDYNQRYIYRLDKKRGEKVFTGKKYGYGFSSDIRQDICEHNDSEEKAVFLEHDLICNLPCVSFITDNFQDIDEDWFYVNVPPMRSCEIVVSQRGLQDSSTGAETQLCIQIPGSKVESINEKVAIKLSNTSYVTKRMNFKIFPNTTELFSSDAGITSIEYTVSLYRIQKYEL